MIGQRNKIKKVLIWSVILGIILLCGVLSMTYGFYEISDAPLYVGLAVAMLGALGGIILFVISPAEMRVQRHGPRETLAVKRRLD